MHSTPRALAATVRSAAVRSTARRLAGVGLARVGPAGVGLARVGLAGVGLAGALAGCGTGSAPSSRPAPVTPAVPIALSAAGSAGGASWAVVRTGGPSVGGRFWQLLVRPAGSGKWRLVTPPGVADNAGLVVAGASDGTLTVGFVPGQQLRFTPLATSTDDGAHWSQGLLPAGLVAAPSALAALPAGRLLAITAKGAQESAPGGTGWTSLVTLRALAATPAGRSCGLIRLTAAASSPSGSPLVGGDCTRAGGVGVFERTDSGWQPAGPMRPGGRAAPPVSVLQMARAGALTSILLAAGAGRREQVYPGWLAGPLAAWRPDMALRIGTGRLESTAVSPSGALAAVGVSGHGMVDDAPLPIRASRRTGVVEFNNLSVDPPAPGATLALGPGTGPITALVPGVSSIVVWIRDKSGNWHQTQRLPVPLVPASP